MKQINGKILLACSYGPDSMALFDMLLKQVGSNGFEVAHVNYHLREESDEEEKGLVEYCKNKGVKCHVYNVEKDLGTSNLEEKCREIRYRFFADIYKNGFKYLYVAHNQDDLIETYIMQKQRGNIVDFYGISAKSRNFGMSIVRPLLKYKKKDLLKYCIENHVPFAIDKTNLENKFLRNQIRHDIVEKLTNKERRDYLKTIKNENKELKAIKAKINKQNLQKVDVLISLDDYEFAIAINFLVHKIQKDVFVSKKYASEIKKALSSEKPNLVFGINPHIHLYKEYENVIIRKENSDEIYYEYKLDKPEILDNKYFYLNFKGDSSNRNVNLDSYPITIRVARPYDVVKIKDYYKSVRRLFIDWKMPKKLRERWPIIIDKNGEVIYIPRYRKDFVVDKDLNFYVK